MYLTLLRMKFSYRIAALLLLTVSGLVLYLSWGSVSIVWDNQLFSKRRETQHKLLAQNLARHSKFPLNAGNLVHLLRNQSQGDEQSDTTCRVLHQQSVDKSVIRTYDILHELNSKMKNGVLTGVYKPEGSPHDVRDRTFKQDPLRIIVIPHSHSDPGWHKTVVEYFNDQTKPTLDNMVDKLLKYPNMTFIWAESVFLHMWWAEANPTMQKSVQELIRRGQLEIVVGSWIVPDEANPHFYALVDQMIEGHQWLEKNFRVKPSSTWSLDPFGYSSTHPYLYQRAGYDNMVILRVHERVKAMLEDQNALEFFWKQNWDLDEETSIFTQLMPYRLYNIKHSCGPDKDICLKFDFRKIPGEYSEARASPVTSSNVKQLAQMLLEQYQKKSSLFKHNVILIPLGDDFRYDREVEWDQQYTNYQLLFDYMNKHLNVQASFGTLQDYFKAVRATAAKTGTPMKDMFPRVEGDFFPYTDERDEYWAGYFTSRPYFKMLGRELEVQLRSAEILHSLTVASLRDQYDELQGNMQLLELARRSLGLYQHHDAITGTARHFVNQDYEMRLKRGLAHAHDVIKSTLTHLLLDPSSPDVDKRDFRVIDVQSYMGKTMLEPNLGKYNIPLGGLRLAVFNPVAQNRDMIVTVTTMSAYVSVTDESGKSVACQVNPIWTNEFRYSRAEFHLSWHVTVGPLAVKVFTIMPKLQSSSDMCSLARISLSRGEMKMDMFPTEKSNSNSTQLENDDVLLKFSSKTGYLHSVTMKHEEKTVETAISFLMYQSARSGAYIFKPSGPADAAYLVQDPVHRVIKGPLFSEVQVTQAIVNHTVRLLHTKGFGTQAIQIYNIVDMHEKNQFELIMRVDSSIKNTDNNFYTDLNGFQVMKRKTFSNFPIEANYYPSTTHVYLEDAAVRMSLVSTQSLGASSQRPGSLEVMLDRRLLYDDGRGLGEGVQDNKRTPSRFLLLLETLPQRTSQETAAARSSTASFPSLSAHMLADHLRHYPVVASLGLGQSRVSYEPVARPLPCDVSLVNLRSLTMPRRAQGSVEAALVLHRLGFDCGMLAASPTLPACQDQPPDGSVNFGQFLGPQNKLVSIKESTLSLMHDKRKVDLSKEEKLKPMNLYAYRLLLG